ncbi:NAD(P)-dependent oxidoreductase [Subtercola boreus]|nr:NAD(P)-dependent oxidoreductase [Subtercola boreus]
MTSAGLDSVPELNPLRERGVELISGPAGRLPTEPELLELVHDVDGWLAGVEVVSARVLAEAPQLRVISRNGVGADAVDLAAAEARGIIVALARGANSRGVAELAILLTMAGLRHLPEANAAMKTGEWQRTLGREMPDITLGLVGFGAIGRLVAELASGLGACVLAHDAYSEVDAASHASSATFAEVFARSDVVSLHSPPPADGSPLVTAEVLATMRRGAVLINTARSALVDDDAVVSALGSGRLSAYAVDAFDNEPPRLSPLLLHEHTILTPHLGGFTDASTRRATEQAVANLITTLGL